MQLYSPLYLSALVPQTIYFKTKQTNLDWALFKEHQSIYKLYLESPTMAYLATPSYFPKDWINRGASGSIFTRYQGIYLKDLIPVLQNIDVVFNSEVHSIEFIDLITQAINLSSKDMLKFSQLTESCRKVLADIKKGKSLGDISTRVCETTRLNLHSKYINIQIYLKEAKAFPNLHETPSIGIEVHVDPFTPNGINITYTQDPVIINNDPFLIKNTVEKFKDSLSNLGYVVG